MNIVVRPGRWAVQHFLSASVAPQTPNAGPQPLPEAEARDERRLEAVGCRRLFGPHRGLALGQERLHLPSRLPFLGQQAVVDERIEGCCHTRFPTQTHHGTVPVF
jgi:hypothetical protein